MTIFQILAWIIIAFVCFIFAPFMTIAIIFIGAQMKVLGYIFIFLGLINMVRKITTHYGS